MLPDRSYAGIVKYDIGRLAASCGLSKSEVGKVNIVVSEMVSNLVKHAPKGGELLVRCLRTEATIGMEIICLDHGPGMHDPQRMLLDGVSTVGTAGNGLGAIKRQSDEFDLYTQPGKGTVILSRLYKGGYDAHAKETGCFEMGAVAAPKLNEELCGDGWAVLDEEHNCYVIVLDGLGHGPEAHAASQQAVQVFGHSLQHDPAAMMRQVHEGIRQTRGAAGMIACIDADKEHINLCGVGNIAGKVFTVSDGPLTTVSKNVVSYNGTLGYTIPTNLNTQELEWNNAKLLILHSDGIKSRWDMSSYPNLHHHDPTTIAAVLYKDHSRQTDDSLVVVVRSKA